jgi:hypothetical protein
MIPLTSAQAPALKASDGTQALSIKDKWTSRAFSHGSHLRWIRTPTVSAKQHTLS